jgi:hypothetical protein
MQQLVTVQIPREVIKQKSVVWDLTTRRYIPQHTEISTDLYIIVNNNLLSGLKVAVLWDIVPCSPIGTGASEERITSC